MSKMQKKKSLVPKKKLKDGAEESIEEKVSAPSALKTASVGVAPKSKADKSVGEAGTNNLFTRVSEFVREVKVELKKVTWPTRKQTTGTTIVVLVFVFVVAAFLGLFDYSLSRLVQVVLT